MAGIFSFVGDGSAWTRDRVGSDVGCTTLVGRAVSTDGGVLVAVQALKRKADTANRRNLIFIVSSFDKDMFSPMTMFFIKSSLNHTTLEKGFYLKVMVVQHQIGRCD